MTPVEHLYLHVPFCARHCPYCDYPVTAHDPPELERWLDVVAAELEVRGGTKVLAGPLRTVLVGGGTPSLLGQELMDGIRRILGDGPLDGVREWTGEANPEDVSEGLLASWREAGVTRVNLGLQSASESALRWLGRAHGAHGGTAALELLAASGIESWGVDLLYGLPPDVEPSPAAGLDLALVFDAPHVSLYEIVPEPGTPLGERVGRGEEELADDTERSRQYLRLAAILEERGYRAYEMTAFARPGHRCRQTSGILRGDPYLGLGPGAHSFVNGRRRWNLRDWQAYSTTVGRGHAPEAGTEVPGAAGRRLEEIWSGLRLAEGLSRSELSAASRDLADRWARVGWAAGDPQRVRLTLEGWLRLDELAIQLARAEDRAVPSGSPRRP
jgi:oxygen-independent coproporphyrinogen-3 oxidase